ncbi:---NA--- : : RNA_pol_A_CTD [Gemmataceae bacterium]|nr:---NA--- : : RNA_pol_A_CTD [Gemmataceae bacterium]VTT98888.1 ---NA--- : : RNA_pol_A_CTD [Gemmataceae bacterium]
MSDPKPTCRTCRFYEACGGLTENIFEDGYLSEGQTAGYCRRYPPTLRGSELLPAGPPEHHTLNWSSPVVASYAWCGEHAPRPDQAPQPAGSPTAELSLFDAGLTARGRKACFRTGVETLNQLAAKRSRDLRSVRNCGERTMAELRAALARHGLHFADEAPVPAACQLVLHNPGPDNGGRP